MKADGKKTLLLYTLIGYREERGFPQRHSSRGSGTMNRTHVIVNTSIKYGKINF